jgi:hypothetical protein
VPLTASSVASTTLAIYHTFSLAHHPSSPDLTPPHPRLHPVNCDLDSLTRHVSWLHDSLGRVVDSKKDTPSGHLRLINVLSDALDLAANDNTFAQKPFSDTILAGMHATDLQKDRLMRMPRRQFPTLGPCLQLICS